MKQTRAAFKNKEDEKVLKRTQHNHQMAATKAATNPIPKNARTHDKMIAGDNTQSTDMKNKNLKRDEAAAKRAERYVDEAKNSVHGMGLTTDPQRSDEREEQKRIQEEEQKRMQELQEQEETDMSADATHPATDPFTPNTTYDPLKERTARMKNDIYQQQELEEQRVKEATEQQLALEELNREEKRVTGRSYF